MMIGSGLQALTTLGKFKPMVLGEIQAAGDIVKVLRKLGFLQPAAKPPGPRLRVCKSDDD